MRTSFDIRSLRRRVLRLTLRVRTRQFDAGILPATSLEIRTLAGLFLAALRAAGIAQHRRHPAASRLCAMEHPGAGPPCPAPFNSDTLRPRADVTVLASVGTAPPSRPTPRTDVEGRPRAHASERGLRRHGGRRSVRPLRTLADFVLYPTAGIRYPGFPCADEWPHRRAGGGHGPVVRLASLAGSKGGHP